MNEAKIKDKTKIKTKTRHGKTRTVGIMSSTVSARKDRIINSKCNENYDCKIIVA